MTEIKINSLKMKCAAAPFFGGDVGDGFGEVPEVAVKVLRVVLALAVGVVFRFREDNGATLARARAVTGGIFDAHLNDVRTVRKLVTLRNGKAAIARLHLDAVIGDSKTDGEAKGL